MNRMILKLAVTALVAEWYDKVSDKMNEAEKVQTLHDLRTSLVEIANNELPTWLPRKEK